MNRTHYKYNYIRFKDGEFMLFSLLKGEITDFGTVVAELAALLIIIFLVLPFHEWAHAYTAYKLGDKSIKYRGRLTFNPLAHIDVIGAACLMFFGFGWAKPVPIDPRNFKNEKVGMAISAVMGPIANLVAALAGAILFFALIAFFPSTFAFLNFGGESFFVNQIPGYVMEFLSFYIQINVFLAVFNLIPVPPLDGSKILFLFLPNNAVNFFYRYETYISIGIFAMLYMGFLSRPISYVSNYIIDGILTIARLPFLWAF